MSCTYAHLPVFINLKLLLGKKKNNSLLWVSHEANNFTGVSTKIVGRHKQQVIEILVRESHLIFELVWNNRWWASRTRISLELLWDMTFLLKCSNCLVARSLFSFQEKLLCTYARLGIYQFWTPFGKSALNLSFTRSEQLS